MISSFDKKRKVIHWTFIFARVFYYFTLLFFVISIVGLCIWAGSSIERFSAEQGLRVLEIKYAWGNGIYSLVEVPHNVMVNLNYERYNIKHMMLLHSIFHTLLPQGLLMIGLKQIQRLLSPIQKDETPFTKESVKAIRIIGICVFSYFIVLDFLYRVAYIVFITQIYAYNIHLSIKGLLLAGAILAIAEIFDYGVFLQSEYDTTL